MSIRTLIFISTHASFLEIFAQFGFMLGTLTVVFFMLELAEITLSALVFEVISANSLSLQFEKLVHFAFAADIDTQIWRLH